MLPLMDPCKVAIVWLTPVLGLGALYECRTFAPRFHCQRPLDSPGFTSADS